MGEPCNCAPGIDGLVIHNSWAHPERDKCQIKGCDEPGAGWFDAGGMGELVMCAAHLPISNPQPRDVPHA